MNKDCFTFKRNKNCFTFEQLCIRRESGFTFDFIDIFSPSNPDSFDDVVYKLLCKINTSLLLLNTHGENIESFTVIAIPLSTDGGSEDGSSKDKVSRRLPPGKHRSDTILDVGAIQNAWNYLSSVGWHCLQSLALLKPDSIPDNGSRKYSLYQFTTCIMDVIRANYMFQKHMDGFHHETMEMFDDADIKEAKQAVFGLLWKRGSTLTKQVAPSLSVLKRTATDVQLNPPPTKSSRTVTVRNTRKQPLPPRNNLDPVEDMMDIDDDEISFKTDAAEKNVQFEPSEEELKAPVPQRGRRKVLQEPSPPPQNDVPQRGRRKVLQEPSPPPQNDVPQRGRRKELQEPSPPPQNDVPQRGRRKELQEPSPPPQNNVTLGFETSVSVAKEGRKSMARKSMSSDWPEEERQNILQIFDNLNPKVTEQKRIALTCKYVALQQGKDLPSKLLYQWVNKKGRPIRRTITSFNIPESDQQKEVALKLFRELNLSNSESARVAYTLKYLDAQYRLNVTSKQLFTWLNEKPVSTRKTQRRM